MTRTRFPSAAGPSGPARAAAAAAGQRRPRPGFAPVGVRARHDGWTPERQAEFIEALGESGCVAEACARVGMTTTSAYALRRRVAAQGFRQAWDIALDYAIRRVADAAFSRALHGVARPVFFQGEQIGERRHFDERLVMFLLRYRDPVRYGAWLDGREARRHPDGAAITLAKAVDRVTDDAYAAAAGDPPPRHAPLATIYHMSQEEQDEDEQRAADARAAAAERADRARRNAEWERFLAADEPIPDDRAGRSGGETGGA